MSSLPSSMKAVRIHEYGDADHLIYEDVLVPTPTAQQCLVEVHHAGINYIDTYHRSGLYPNPLPLTLGREGSGIVKVVGADVKDVSVGDKVVFFAQGSYAEYVCVEGSSVYKLPSGVDTQSAAASYLQGLTAHYLVCTTFPCKAGDTVLVHAAAGGTGRLIVQVAKIKGATVIGTVGSEVKAELAREAGCDHVINYSQADFLVEVKKLTNNVGVSCVYDGVGAQTYERSMKCLKKLGYLVLFGNASGPVPPISPLDLTRAGSLFLTRPSLVDYIATRADLENRSKDLFTWLATGQLKLTIAALLPLADAAKAHQMLEGRGIAGKIVLVIKQ